MTLLDPPLAILLDDQPIDIIGIDTGSYVATDGRTWRIPPAGAGTDAETIQSHIEAEIAHPTQDPLPIPPEVSRARFLVALYTVHGLTKDAIQQVIDGIEDAAQQYVAQVWFDDAATFRRDNPILATLAQMMGKTPPEIDAVFVAASQIAD